jgi:hypothetical protein
MDKNSAAQFKSHVESIIRELSLSHAVAERSATREELTIIKRSIGHIIASLDEMLHDAVYPDHPELNHLSGR